MLWRVMMLRVAADERGMCGMERKRLDERQRRAQLVPRIAHSTRRVLPPPLLSPHPLLVSLVYIMSAPKIKAAPAAKKPNGKQNGSAAPAPAVTKSNGDVAKEDAAATVGGSSRPDKAAYDAEQARIKSEIDALQLKVVRASLLFCPPHTMSSTNHASFALRVHFTLGCSQGQDRSRQQVWHW